MRIFSRTFLCAVLLAVVQSGYAADIVSHISIKQPGNRAVTYELKEQGNKLVADAALPLTISKSVSNVDGEEVVTLTFTATGTTYFNFGAELNTGYTTDDCEFYMPGFWYHRNLRSPKEAPSFHTSKSWNFREDRLSSPLTGAYDSKTGEGTTVLRQVENGCDALATAGEGEIILSGNTSVGYLGFDNESGTAKLTFGYPYIETPRRYIRKLTLAPAVEAFVKMVKGETKSVSWRIRKVKSADYGDFVGKTWEYCFDRLNPQPLTPLYSPEKMKATMANYFRKSYVNKYDLKFNSGHGLRCSDCEPATLMQVGFCGRVLLNAFNAIEYGEATGQQDLVKIGNEIFDSFLAHGFTAKGYFYDDLNMNNPMPADKDVVHSIRQQSEGAYAVMHYLKYEKKHGRTHKEWEKKIRTLLDNFLTLLNEDGSFARKFHDDGSVIDGSGGSTPSATSTLVMGYKYFGDKKYLKAAERTVDYLEANIISKSDYFSSTLDANCEDKEASLYAATAAYYLALVTKGEERAHYAGLAKKAAYFALSWYYTWDVPFAEGQMLGDIGLKTRGWGNVSVENNHIDVFIFEFADVLHWLSKEYNEPRFSDFAEVISTSMRQLLPYEGHMCGIAKVGYYPEVVQHTNWDYGRNGKGYYNNIFAPGWTVASLWELFTPGRAEQFLLKK